MGREQRIVDGLALVVFGICVYAFLLGNEVFKGKFTNDGISWYFLAKGIFCSTALSLLVRILTFLQLHKRS